MNEVKVTIKDDYRECELCGEVAVEVAQVIYPDGVESLLVSGCHESVSAYEREWYGTKEWDGTKEGIYKHILEEKFRSKVRITDLSEGGVF
jgi:hypothetical protein